MNLTPRHKRRTHCPSPKVHGKGTLVYTYGDKFIGDWVDAKKHGDGELLYVNGDRFKVRSSNASFNIEQRALHL